MNVEIFNYSSYQMLLKDELAERKRRNPTYSSRAYARDLNLSIGMLSQVLNFKKQLSTAKAEGVAKDLLLEGVKKDYFISLVDSQTQTDPKLKFERISFIFQHGQFFQREKVSELQLGLFDQWYGSMVLTSLDIEEFQLNPGLIAKTINVSEETVLQTLANLIQAGLVNEQNGRYAKTITSPEVATDVSSNTIKNFHFNQVVKSQEALLSQPMDKRHFMHLSFVYDDKYKKEIIGKIHNFIDEMNQYDSMGKPNSVAALNTNILFFERNTEEEEPEEDGD